MFSCISTESYESFYVQLFLTEKLVSLDIMKNKEEILELIEKELSGFFRVRESFVSNWKCKVIFCWLRGRLKCYRGPHLQVKHKMLSSNQSQVKRNHRLPPHHSKTFMFPFVSCCIQLSYGNKTKCNFAEIQLKFSYFYMG